MENGNIGLYLIVLYCLLWIIITILFYNRIWADGITRLKSRPQTKNNWALPSMVFMTMAMVINFAFLMGILQNDILRHYFYHFEVVFLPEMLNAAVSFLALFILPCALINYLLIFYGNRYIKLLGKYRYYNGKLFLSYFIISLSTPLIILWTAIILGGVKVYFK